MKNIFIGFLLVFLNFSLDFGNSRIGLIPDFLGYMVMINGLNEMAKESMLFEKIKPYVTGMAVYSGILYILDLIGFSMSFGIFSYGLAFISTVISLYISYNIVMGVLDTESKHSKPLNGDRLKSTWTLLAVVNIMTYVFLIIPVLSLMSIIAAFIIAILFLVEFNNSKKRYYDMF